MGEEDSPGADPSQPDESVGPGTVDAGDGRHDVSDVEGSDGATGVDDRESGSRREVVVPLSLYKTVTVFSTLLAIVLVVGGMIVLDQATGRSTFDAEEVSLPLATAGVLSIVLGAAVYAFSTRFRAEGMGNPKEDADEGSNDG